MKKGSLENLWKVCLNKIHKATKAQALIIQTRTKEEERIRLKDYQDTKLTRSNATFIGEHLNRNFEEASVPSGHRDCWSAPQQLPDVNYRMCQKMTNLNIAEDHDEHDRIQSTV